MKKKKEKKNVKKKKMDRSLVVVAMWHFFPTFFSLSVALFIFGFIFFPKKNK